MTSTLRLWALLALLAVAQAAPPPPHANGRFFKGHARRQAIGADLVLTETRVEVLSETQTETFTETFTTTESASTSTNQVASTTSAGPASSIATALPLPAVHLVGDIPNPDPNAQTILFLPLESSLLSLVSDSAAPAPTDSPSASDSSTASPTSSDAVASSVSPGFSAAQSPTIQGPILSAYYPDWVASTLPPESIDMSRLDWIDFAFVTPAQDFSLTWDDPSSSPALLQRLVAAAHAKNTKVKLSIGGWSGSQYFSPACATQASRTTFVGNVVKLYNAYKLDGIDIDWEYPAQQGEGDNTVNPQDSANFLAMLRQLRTSLPKTARITAAVQDVPFVDAQGNPMTDVSAFAAVLDWVNIMNYDVFGSSNKPGPNAPLANGCKDSSQPSANAVSAINAWSAAKFPAGRLMLGVPFYGYLSGSHATQLQHKKRSLASASGYNFGMMRRQTDNETQDTQDTQDTQTDGDLTPSTSSAASMSSQSPVGDTQTQDTQDSQTDGDLTTSTSMEASMSSQSPNGLAQAGSGSAEPSISMSGTQPSSQADPASPSASISTQGTDAEAAQFSSSNGTTSFASSSSSSTPGTTTLKSPDSGSTTSGQLQFSSLLSQNALVAARVGRTSSAVTFLAVGGFTRFWDACSSTPFLSSPYANQVVTYDDPQSLGLKAAYAKKAGILGTAVWDLSGDTAQWDLMNALRTGLGKPV